MIDRPCSIQRDVIQFIRSILFAIFPIRVDLRVDPYSNHIIDPCHDERRSGRASKGRALFPMNEPRTI